MVKKKKMIARDSSGLFWPQEIIGELSRAVSAGPMTNYNNPLLLQKERKKRASFVLLLKMNFMSVRSTGQIDPRG